MAYNILGPVHVVTAGDMSASINSDATQVRTQDNVGIQLKWTGTPTGTFDVQVSMDHIEDAEGTVLTAGNWISLPLDPGIVAAGGPDDAYIDLNQLSAFYVRVRYIRTSGSGSLEMYVDAKGV